MEARALRIRGMTGRRLSGGNASRGQVLILAVVLIFFFFLVAVALIDVYSVMEARVWGYRVAQQAALYGVSGTLGTATNWKLYDPTLDPSMDTPTPRTDNCINPIRIELDPDRAYAQTESMIVREMEGRGLVPAAYDYEIRVLPDYDGGSVLNWPTPGARLGMSGDWSAANPAVAVYLTIRVTVFLSSVVGYSTVPVHVFAAAEVSQPPRCPE